MQIHREVPFLKAECQRRGIHPPYDNPTAEQLIPIIEQHLATHQKHFGRNFEPGSGYRNEWEQINTDLEQFLAQLRTAAGHPTKTIAENPNAGNPNAGRASCPQLAASVTNVSSNPQPPSVTNAPPPAPTNPPKTISPENAGLSGSTIPNQQPTAGSEPVSAGSMPVSAGSDPVPAGSEPSAPASNPDAAKQSQKPNAEHPRQDERRPPNTGPQKEIKIEDYLQGDSVEAALDLQSYLAGRSPLDDLPLNEQQAIVRLLKDYHAWRVLEVVQQPRPVGLGIRTSKTALNLFARRFNHAKEEAVKTANQKAIDDLMAAANGSDDVFQTAVQRCLKSRLLTAASEPNAKLADIAALVLSLTRLRKQALAENKS